MINSRSLVPEVARIQLLLQHGRPELAEQAVRQRLVADPTDWRAYILLTQALSQLNRLAEAAQAAGEAIRLAPQAYEAYYALSQVQGRQGHLLEAEATVAEALQLAPYQGSLYGYRAQLCYLLRQYTATEQCAEDGLRLDAEQADCLLWRALAQEAQNDPGAADADFTRLLRVAPASGLVRRRLGQVLLRRYEPRAAAPHLAEALRQAPEQATELVPLLRQARRRATWPNWLLLGRRQFQQEWQVHQGISSRGFITMLVLPLFLVRSWWLTRRDPLFQHPLPAKTNLIYAPRPVALYLETGGALVAIGAALLLFYVLATTFSKGLAAAYLSVLALLIERALKPKE